MGKKLQLSGRVFKGTTKYGIKFRVKVVCEAKVDKPGVFWKCICKCKKKFVAAGWLLNRGQVKGCGCLQKEFLALGLNNRQSYIIGGTRRNCSSCKKVKVLSKFHKSKKRPDGYASSCKECHYFKIVKKLYGISKERYLVILKNQQEICPICLRKFSKNPMHKDYPVVDHCHSSGKVRGILHKYCNAVIVDVVEKFPTEVHLAALYLSKTGTK